MNVSKEQITYCVVIPVYNSADIVEETINRTVAFFEQHRWDFELILVNDGSTDQSWDVLCQKASADSRLMVIDLLRNYGQHTAIFCGLQESRGEFVITLDDDLQNPPEEILLLLEKSHQGHDLVFGRFREKKHPLFRRLGSLFIGLINRRIFRQPRGLVPTNFRVIRRSVVDRMCAYQTSYPYITGLALLFAANPANAWVEHQKRPVGKSQYTFFKILELVMRILFNYSSFPLRLLSLVGIVISTLSFLMALYFIGKAIWIGVNVPGWTTVVVLLSFFNGLTILSLSLLGEYTIRLLRQTSTTESYQIKDIVKSSR